VFGNGTKFHSTISCHRRQFVRGTKNRYPRDLFAHSREPAEDVPADRTPHDEAYPVVGIVLLVEVLFRVRELAESALLAAKHIAHAKKPIEAPMETPIRNVVRKNMASTPSKRGRLIRTASDCLIAR
jgi:hypothetical protein